MRHRVVFVASLLAHSHDPVDTVVLMPEHVPVVCMTLMVQPPSLTVQVTTRPARLWDVGELVIGGHRGYA